MTREKNQLNIKCGPPFASSCA
uniref:Uncharacterized protein n=1 Tax=Arundo donax TaxID=35708 RepID=A0A0A8Z257_ARUDO